MCVASWPVHDTVRSEVWQSTGVLLSQAGLATALSKANLQKHCKRLTFIITFFNPETTEYHAKKDTEDKNCQFTLQADPTASEPLKPPISVTGQPKRLSQVGDLSKVMFRGGQ